MKISLKNEKAIATTNDPRWAQVQTRDKTQDGAFYYSVSSISVYCKPSCASRTARPENIIFHDSCEAAESAGFRPCKRCKLGQQNLEETHTTIVTESCRLIVESEQTLNLVTLASKAGLSSYHFHRVFKAIMGLTLKAYSDAFRAQKLRVALAKKNNLTNAIFEACYQSNSRFYNQSATVLGMKPTHYRAGGTNANMCFAVGECSLGAVLVASSFQGVCAILLGDSPEKLALELYQLFPQVQISADDKHYQLQVAIVIHLIEAPNIALNLPLDIRGPVFQQQVWQALREIPAGKTHSYSQLAQKIGKPKVTRPVASACAANKIAVVIPCHRIVRNDGALSGYRWGASRKASLLV